MLRKLFAFFRTPDMAPMDSLGFFYSDPYIHPDGSVLTPQRLSATVTNPAFKPGRALALMSQVNVHAFLETAQGANKDVAFVAKTPGSSPGISIRVAYVVSGASTPLSVSVSTNDITINVKTTAGSVADSTADEIIAAVLASAAANALVFAFRKTGNDGTGKPAAMAFTALIDTSGGATGDVTLENSIDAGVSFKAAYATIAQVTNIASSGKQIMTGPLGDRAQWKFTVGGAGIQWVTLVSKMRGIV